MKTLHWLKQETKALFILFLYFTFYFGIFIILKKLILAHYHISFYGLGGALLGAFIAAKAVLVIEKTLLSRPLRTAAPYLKILYDTLIFTTLALVFLYLEKIVELAHKEGTFGLAWSGLKSEEDWYQFAAIVVWAGLSFLSYAVFAAISRHMGEGELRRFLFTSPQSRVNPASNPE